MVTVYHRAGNIHGIGDMLYEKLLGITWVSNPATRKDLAART